MKKDPPKKKKSIAQRAAAPTRVQGETYESKLLNKGKVRTKLKPTPESVEEKRKARRERYLSNRKALTEQVKKTHTNYAADTNDVYLIDTSSKETKEKAIAERKEKERIANMRYNMRVKNADYGKKRTKLSDIEKARLKKKS